MKSKLANECRADLCQGCSKWSTHHLRFNWASSVAEFERIRIKTVESSQIVQKTSNRRSEQIQQWSKQKTSLSRNCNTIRLKPKTRRGCSRDRLKVTSFSVISWLAFSTLSGGPSGFGVHWFGLKETETETETSLRRRLVRHRSPRHEARGAEKLTRKYLLKRSQDLHPWWPIQLAITNWNLKGYSSLQRDWVRCFPLFHPFAIFYTILQT